MTSEMVESAWASIGYFLHQLDQDIRRLEHLQLKILKKKESMVFNQTCLDNDLLPKYVIYIYTYRYIHTHILYKYTHMYIYTYSYKYIQMYIHMYIYIYIYIYAHTYIHIHANIFIYTHMQTHTHIYIHLIKEDRHFTSAYFFIIDLFQILICMSHLTFGGKELKKAPYFPKNFQPQLELSLRNEHWNDKQNNKSYVVF